MEKAMLETDPLLNGMWQVSGGHGPIDPKRAVSNMLDYHDAGFKTWDLADHYGPAEDFVGVFRRELAARSGPSAVASVRTFTKWVPSPGEMAREVVKRNIDRSLRRMDVEGLDLLQFHWWEYGDDRYLDALRHLAEFREAGTIRALGLTNFDTEHVQRILDAGIPVVSNQVQFSLIDRRPLVKMSPHCSEHGLGLLAYGVLAGGLLSDRYLGKPEPNRATLDTASLGKYKQMVDAWGGWNLFQSLLQTLDGIARKHRVSIANVATRYVLEQPAVLSVIIGVRLGVSDNRVENAATLQFALDEEDYSRLESVQAASNDLFRVIGDCGDEYRR